MIQKTTTNLKTSLSHLDRCQSKIPGKLLFKPLDKIFQKLLTYSFFFFFWLNRPLLKSLDSDASRLFDSNANPIISIHLQARHSLDESSSDLNSGAHNSWRLSQWSKRLHGATLFTMDEEAGTIEIPTDGLYLVYAQVFIILSCLNPLTNPIHHQKILILPSWVGLFTFSRYIYFLSRCSQDRLSVTLLVLSRFQTFSAQPYWWRRWAITTNHNTSQYGNSWHKTLLEKIQKISILILILHAFFQSLLFSACALYLCFRSNIWMSMTPTVSK